MGAKETNFNWLWADGTLFEFNNWAKGRPDSPHSPDSPDEACLKVYGSKYNSSYPLHPGYEYIKEHKKGEWENIRCDVDDYPGSDCPDAPAYHPNKDGPECVNECLPYKDYGSPNAYYCTNIKGDRNACLCGGFYMCSIPLGIFLNFLYVLDISFNYGDISNLDITSFFK